MNTNTNIEIIIDILHNKKTRQLLCINYIDENPNLSAIIVEFWQLNRIKNKYILQIRPYDENSYSKQKIKEEEIIFLRKQSLYQPIRYYFEEQRILNDVLFNNMNKYKNDDFDNKIYIDSINNNFRMYCFPSNPFVLKKNNRYRIDLTNEMLEIPVVRERCVKGYLEKYHDLVLLFIDKYSLKFIKYKYINKTISKFESSYTRNKIKVEEMFLLNKILQMSIWMKRVEIYLDLEEKLINDYVMNSEPLNKKQNIIFKNIIIKKYIEEFRLESFEIDIDINLN